MAKGSFTIGDYSQEIIVNHEHITGRHDNIHAFLNIYVELTLRLQKENKNISYDFLSIHSKLLLLKEGIEVSSLITPCDFYVFNKENITSCHLSFPLTKSNLNFIEKVRNGSDLNLKIEFVFHTLRKNALQLIENEIMWTVDGTRNFRGEIQFVVPRSFWIETVLPKLGLPGFKLFEIPLTHSSIMEAYDDIINEFNSAEKYFIKGDYNQCVGHCRHTMDHLSRNLKKVKDQIDSESAFNWLSKIDKATLAWIDDVNKALSAIGSKPHHIGLKKDFTRREAESIYLVTLGLMNFVGQCAHDNDHG